MTTLKIVRMSKHMTQADVAQKAGLTQPWYSLIESGRLQPNESQKKRISEVIGVPAEKLFQPFEIAM